MQPAANARPVLLYGYDSTGATFRPVVLDGTGQIATASAAASASFRNIAGAATTTVKSAAGTLTNIVINKTVAASVITIYDSLTATGTKIATITQPAVLVASQITLTFQCAFTIGLTIVTSLTDDITVMYI